MKLRYWGLMGLVLLNLSACTNSTPSENTQKDDATLETAAFMNHDVLYQDYVQIVQDVYQFEEEFRPAFDVPSNVRFYFTNWYRWHWWQDTISLDVQEIEICTEYQEKETCSMQSIKQQINVQELIYDHVFTPETQKILPGKVTAIKIHLGDKNVAYTWWGERQLQTDKTIVVDLHHTYEVFPNHVTATHIALAFDAKVTFNNELRLKIRPRYVGYSLYDEDATYVYTPGHYPVEITTPSGFELYTDSFAVRHPTVISVIEGGSKYDLARRFTLEPFNQIFYTPVDVTIPFSTTIFANPNIDFHNLQAMEASQNEILDLWGVKEKGIFTGHVDSFSGGVYTLGMNTLGVSSVDDRWESYTVSQLALPLTNEISTQAATDRPTFFTGLLINRTVGLIQYYAVRTPRSLEGHYFDILADKDSRYFTDSNKPNDFRLRALWQLASQRNALVAINGFTWKGHHGERGDNGKDGNSLEGTTYLFYNRVNLRTDMAESSIGFGTPDGNGLNLKYYARASQPSDRQYTYASVATTTTVMSNGECVGSGRRSAWGILAFNDDEVVFLSTSFDIPPAYKISDNAICNQLLKKWDMKYAIRLDGATAAGIAFKVVEGNNVYYEQYPRIPVEAKWVGVYDTYRYIASGIGIVPFER